MTTRKPLLILLALGGAFAVLCLAPVLTDWSGSAIGAACSDAPDGLWRLWSTHQGAAPVGFPAAESTVTHSAPAVTLGFEIFSQIMGSPIAAWNALVVLAFSILTVGTIALGYRIAPNAPLLAHITLVVAVVGASAWSPLIRHAGVEILPMVCAPGVLALLHRWLHPDASPWVGVSTALLFSIAMLGHWASTVLTMTMVFPMAIVLTRHWEGRQARERLLLALLPGAALGALHVSQTYALIPGIHVDAGLLAAAWIHQTEGALLLPATAAVALPSLGLLILALAGVAARPKDTAGWLLCSTWGILLAAGSSSLSPSAILPAQHMTELIPGLSPLESWWAIAPLVAIPLGIAALRGVEALHRAQRSLVAMGVLFVALVDQTLPAVVTTGSQRISPALGVSTRTALSNLPPGAVLQLPATENECGQTARKRLWQPLHGRAVSTAAPGERDGGLLISHLARLAANHVKQPGAQATPKDPLDTDTLLCATADLQSLYELGFAVVALDNHSGEHTHTAALLNQVMGEPISEEQGLLLWSVEDALPAMVPEPCVLPNMDQG